METLMFLGFSYHAWITIITVVGLFATLLFTKVRTDFVFFSAIGILFVTGVLDTKEAFSGFGATATITVFVLFIVVAGLTYTGVLQWIVKNLLGQPKTYKMAIVRLMVPVALLSSFLSNTTVVTIFVNIVKIWAKKLHITPSRLLIPLSYASGMGGVCTLIGTPPNMIISGLYAEKTGEVMNVFITLVPGLFCLGVGILSVIAMSRLLPEREAKASTFEDTADYTIEMRVPSKNPYIGNMAGDAGLINVNGGRLIKWYHFDGEPVPIENEEFIMGGDRLVYAGKIKEIRQLTKTHNLVVGEDVIEIGFKTFISSLIMIAMIAVSALGYIPLLQCAFIAAGAMLLCRCCTPNQAMNAIHWDILIVFAASAALGLAIQKTGIAEQIAYGILNICGSHPLVVMTAVCLVGTFITEFISNTAAGAMFFPIMYEAAEKLGYDPLPFVIALMISVSSSFATPIGSPTHMLVYAPGGYRFSDFMRIGLLMNIIILAANILIVNTIFPLTPLTK